MLHLNRVDLLHLAISVPDDVLHPAVGLSPPDLPLRSVRGGGWKGALHHMGVWSLLRVSGALCRPTRHLRTHLWACEHGHNLWIGL